MKKLGLILVAGALAAQAFGADVRVSRGEGVAESLAESVAAALERNGNVEVGVAAGPERAEGESAADYALRAGAGEGIALVLIDDEGEEIGGKAFAEEGVALLNLARLGDKDTPAQTLVARACREALRAYAHLMGLPPCPFPLCVLTHCGSVEALDEMSQSYCPPCWESMRALAAEKGFEVLPVAQPKEQEN